MKMNLYLCNLFYIFVVRDDFLALFESNSQPKMNRPRGAGQTQKTSASKPMKATWDALVRPDMHSLSPISTSHHT